MRLGENSYYVYSCVYIGVRRYRTTVLHSCRLRMVIDGGHYILQNEYNNIMCAVRPACIIFIIA